MSLRRKVLKSLEFPDLQGFPGFPTIFQNFAVLENAWLKYKYFPGFLGPVQTICSFYGITTVFESTNKEFKICYVRTDLGVA